MTAADGDGAGARSEGEVLPDASLDLADAEDGEAGEAEAATEAEL